MHEELSLAEISPAVHHDSFKHHCYWKCIRGGPISVSSIIAPPESLLDARSSVLEVHREAKSRPSTSAPWDLISEKLCIEVNGERKIIFRSCLNCATNYTYDVCQS